MPVRDEDIAAAIAALNPQQRAQLESALSGGMPAEPPKDVVTDADLEFERRSMAGDAEQKRQFMLGNKAAGAGPVGTEQEGFENLMELAPAIGAAAGTAVAPGPGSVAGGTAGEAARQLFRRMTGKPQATGVMQRAFNLDPNSPEAAAAGLAGETTAGVMGAGASKLLKWLSGAHLKSATRSIIRDLLGGARTERQIEEAPRLAARAQEEGIVGLRGFTQEARKKQAEKALADATAKTAIETQKAVQAGADIEAMPVLDAIQGEIPTLTPGGMVRKASMPERRAALKVLDDELNAVASTGRGPTGTRVPVETVLDEIKALDDQLEAMYRRGAMDPALGKKATKAGVDAFRVALRNELPELADARLRKHDLIMITQMLADVQKSGFTARGMEHELAGTAGAAAVGRYGPAGSALFARAARGLAPLTIPGKQLLAKLLAGGADTAQLWVRAADMYGLADDTDTVAAAERRYRAAESLKDKGEAAIDK